MTNVLISHLADACRDHLLDEKWLVAPSRRVAHQWLERLTRSGAPVVNVRVHTTRSLAIALLTPGLAKGSVAMLGPAGRRIVVAAAWTRAMRSADDGDAPGHEGGYLGSARTTPRLLALAERTVHDLRMSGLTPAALPPERFERHDKGRELRRLLEAYEDELSRRRLIDHADATRRAAGRLRERPDEPAGVLLLVPEDLRLAALERELIECWSRDRRFDLRVDRPAEPASTAAPDPDGDGTDRALLGWITHPGQAPPPRGDGTARIVHAVGEINEVRAAFRACLADATPLDRIELLYTAGEPYVPIILDTAQRLFDVDDDLDLGVPLTFADGVPARLSRPGRLLMAWLDWIESDYPQTTLLSMLAAGLLELPVDDDGNVVGSSRLIRVLRSVGIGFGRARYLRCLDRIIDGLARQVERDGRADTEHARPRHGGIERRRRELHAARRLRQVVTPLIESGHEAGTAADVMTAAARLLGDHVRCANRLDRLARQHLRQEIESMARALAADGSGTPPGFDPWLWLAELPDRIRVAGSAPRPGHLHVAPLHGGGHSGRPHTMVLGLDDGRHPSGGRQDPLLLDAERGRLSDALPTAAAELHEQLDEFARLLCRLRGRVTLSFPGRDLHDDRELFAGPAVLSAFRILSGRRTGDHNDLLEWLDPAASFAPLEPERCLDLGEWWLCRGAQGERVANLDALAAVAFPHMVRGRDATAARATDAFTAFDGLVECPDPELDPCHADGPVLSATSGLKALGACPLKYFLGHVLRISPPDDVAVDPHRWLDPLQFGTLLHDVLYAFVGDLLAEQRWPPRPQDDLERMARLIDRELDAKRLEVPPPNDDAERRQRREMHRAGEIFVNEQAREGGRSTPAYLEAAIGTREQAGGTPIDVPDPVAFGLPRGKSIRIRARVDRIDRVKQAGPDGAPRFRIIDYKSGGYVKPYDPPDLFDQGRLLQHVIYMAVVESVLRSQASPAAVVDEFAFMFPGPRAHGRSVMFGGNVVAPGRQVVDRLCKVAAGGAFIATDDVGDCTFCDYRSACRAVDRDLETLCARSARKLAEQDNALLRPFAELRRGR